MQPAKWQGAAAIVPETGEEKQEMLSCHKRLRSSQTYFQPNPTRKSRPLR